MEEINLQEIKKACALAHATNSIVEFSIKIHPGETSTDVLERISSALQDASDRSDMSSSEYCGIDEDGE